MYIANVTNCNSCFYPKRLKIKENGKYSIKNIKKVKKEKNFEETNSSYVFLLKEKNLKDNTLLWYCGDNGTPPSAGRTGMTIREDKGSLYEGGVLVPGVLEWPAKIQKPTVTKTISVTSDFLPTLAELAGVSVPDRPIVYDRV